MMIGNAEAVTRGTSLLDAAVAKYLEDMKDDTLGVLVSRSPTRRTAEGKMLLPQIVSMDACQISAAGDPEELKELCKIVEELDLMKNKIKCWHEVRVILQSCGALRSLNLSQNPLKHARDAPDWPPDEKWIKLTTLALNDTGIDWPQLLSLLTHFPELQELHIAKNELCHVPESPHKFLAVNRLIYNNNCVVSFAEVLRLSKLFPCLEHLLLAGNGLETIVGVVSKAMKHDPLTFHFLSYLNLSDNFLTDWCCIDQLALFPTLIDLRLNGNPLLDNISISEARMQAIARLPEIVRLNGSPVGEEERVDAERAFIRLFMNKPIEERPPRYNILVEKHGNLDPLANVNLKPQSNIKFVLRCGEEEMQKKVYIDQTVGELKKVVCGVFKKMPSGTRLFYLDKEINDEEELKYPRRKMHSYRPKDGDELILTLK